MRLIWSCLLALLLIAAAQGPGEARDWAEHDWPLGNAVSLLNQGCEVLDEPDLAEQMVEVSVRLYEPPVTNDDRTELFWAPAAAAPATHWPPAPPVLQEPERAPLAAERLLRPPRPALA